MKEKNTARAILGNFYIEFQAKSTLFGHFIRDAYDWIRLYHSSLKCESLSLSIQTKQFMHLRMALECSLKSILIGLSKQGESASDVYKTVRRCSHNLERLVNESKARAGTNYRICTRAMMDRLKKIDRLGIGVRYDVDMKTAYKRQSFAEVYSGEGPVSGVLVNEDFHKQIRKDVGYFMKLARRIHDKRLARHSGGLLSNMITLENYIRRILA